VWHDSTDPTEFRLLKLVYNGQEFSSTEEFIEAYESNRIAKISITVNPEWSSFSRYYYLFIIYYSYYYYYSYLYFIAPF
jgi:hypothetical protein